MSNRIASMIFGIVLVVGLPYAWANPPQVFEFVYDPDNPDNPSGYTMFDGHLRCGRNADQNWSGSNSLQVWKACRFAVSHFDGWLDELPKPITHAEIEYQVRNVAGTGDDPPPMVVETYPMAVPVDIGNGDGWAQPGWMTWEHLAADRSNPANAVGWGTLGLGQNGPIYDQDYLLSPMVESIVDTVAYGRHTEFHTIDITSIAQGWQNGEFPNYGIFMKGVAEDSESERAEATLYFVGADTAKSGFLGAINPDEVRTMPVLRVTVAAEPTVTGDVNNDGNVDNLDITPFIAALAAEDEAGFLAAFPDGNYTAADIDMSGGPDNLDITPFIGLLTAAGSNATAVPEPSSLACVVLALMMGRRRAVRRPPLT